MIKPLSLSSGRSTRKVRVDQRGKIISVEITAGQKRKCNCDYDNRDDDYDNRDDDYDNSDDDDNDDIYKMEPKTKKLRSLGIIDERVIKDLFIHLLDNTDEERYYLRKFSVDCIDSHFKDVKEKVSAAFVYLCLNGDVRTVPILTECCAEIFVRIEQFIAQSHGLIQPVPESFIPLPCGLINFIITNTMKISEFVSELQDALLAGDQPDEIRLDYLLKNVLPKYI